MKGGQKIKMDNSYELYHHGILGMKWGVRRFQNSDGSLTPEGKLRYGYDYKKGKYRRLSLSERRAVKRRNKQLEKARKVAEAEKQNKSPRNKKITEMTDKQLQKYIDRMNLEKSALEIRNKVKELDPKPVSKGERFMNSMIDKVVIPTVQKAGEQFVAALVKKATESPKKAPDKYSVADKESKYWENLSKIESNKASYNKTKAINNEYDKTKNINVYKSKNNNNKDDQNNK